MMDVLLVNGVNFSHNISSYSFTEEDQHSSDSGRNPLDGLMEFSIVSTKKHLDIEIRRDAPEEWVYSLIAAMKANGRVNEYTVFDTTTGQTVTFTGYINQRRISLLERSVRNGTRLQSFTIKIVEM